MKKQRLSLSRRQDIIGVVFLLPFLIHFSMFLIYPFFSTAYTSLTNANLMSLTEKFVGLKNYQNVLKDKLFITSLKNTGLYLLIDGVGVVIFGMLMALALNQKIRGIFPHSVLYSCPGGLGHCIHCLSVYSRTQFWRGQLCIESIEPSAAEIFDQSAAVHAHHSHRFRLERIRLLCRFLPCSFAGRTG